MNKAKLPRDRFPIANMLFLGSLVLGIGCIIWALINIGAQSTHFANAYRTPSSSLVTFDEKVVGLAEEDVAVTEPDHSDDILDPVIVLYPEYPAEGDNIGSLSIPVLKQELPIIQGTGADELKKGVGHFTQSVLPGEEGNCVLSGHRDTVFAKLGKLITGDQLIVQTTAGIYTYEIKDIRIVDKDDKTVIVPADHAILTLTTCYPFIFVGSAPERYILIADLVTNNLTSETEQKLNKISNGLKK